MATKVPISTKPLPPTSSVSCRCCGRIENFKGPKKVDCTPNKNSTASMAAAFCKYSDNPASTATAISKTLMRRIKRDFSYLSAICPAVAENRKKGSTNSPAAAFTAKSADSAATMPP